MTPGWNIQLSYWHTDYTVANKHIPKKYPPQDINDVSISGLDGATYVDKVDGASVKTQAAGGLSITGETDRVYTPTGGVRAPVSVSESGRKTFEVVRDNLEDVVVWNPWTAKAASMADFEPKDGFRNMLCVEAGAVKGWQTLEPGDALEGAQTITAW
jgi:glucose-6-phosphate 1-epimerase